MSLLSQPYIAVIVVPILVIFVCLRQYFVRSSREIKRIEALSKLSLLLYCHKKMLFNLLFFAVNFIVYNKQYIDCSGMLNKLYYYKVNQSKKEFLYNYYTERIIHESAEIPDLF